MYDIWSQFYFWISNLSGDIILSICAVLVAICAVVISVTQGNAQRRHNELSVKPKIDIKFYIDIDYKSERLKAKFFMVNSGLGPAIVSSYEVKCSDKVIQPHDFLRSFLKKEGRDVSRFNSVAPNIGSAISPGSSLDLIYFETSVSGVSQHLDFLNTILSHDIVVSFGSFYGTDTQTTNLGKDRFYPLIELLEKRGVY